MPTMGDCLAVCVLKLHWQKVGGGMSEGKGLLHILCSMVHKDDYVSDRRSVRLAMMLVLLPRAG